MDPSEARREALHLHDEVRDAMRAALVVATQVQRGELSHAGELRTRAVALGAALRRHASVEHAEIGPVLRSLDAWGPVRCDQLAAAHGEQERAWNHAEAALRACAPGGSPTEAIELARTLHQLVRSLVRSFRFEESKLLDPETLRDDIVTVDTIDG